MADAVEWSCLQELLQLDVAPFESRLQRCWALLVRHKAPALAAQLLRSYALLADLSSCLEALKAVLEQSESGEGLLEAEDFVAALEEASSSLSSPGLVQSTWKMLLEALKASKEPWPALLLRPFLAGLRPNELQLARILGV